MVGILLAAGSSKRFGGNKITAKLPNSKPVGIQSAERLKTCVDEMIVVVNSKNTDTKQLFTDHHFNVKVSEKSEGGMGYSLSDGISSTLEATHWIIALADMPYLAVSTMSKLRELLVVKNQITVPIFDGQLGHPVGFPRTYRKQLLKLEGDRGAKSIIDGSAPDTFFFMSSDFGVVRDIDVRSELMV